MAPSSVTPYEITLWMPPGEIRLNRKNAKTGRISRHWKKARQAIIRDLINDFYGRATFEGDLFIYMELHWPNTGDVDAIHKGLFDALKKSRVIIDDDQFDTECTRKFRISTSPRIVVHIEPMGPNVWAFLARLGDT